MLPFPNPARRPALAGWLLAAVLLGACDSATDDGPMTAETADLSGTYVMLPLADSDDPFVGAGTITYEMSAVALEHRADALTGTAECRWTFTPMDPLGAPLIQLGDAVLSGSYHAGYMELNVAGDRCPRGAFAGSWTMPDTLIFDVGGYFDDDAPVVLVLEVPAP